MPETPVGAFIHTPGAQELWIKFRGQSQAAYWGTAVTAPEFEEVPRYLEVKNDLAGRQEPFQLIYDGQSAMVAVTLNRLDLAVTRTVRDHWARNGSSQTGNDPYYARGSAVLGSTDFQVVVINSFGGTVYQAAGMNTGRLYYACTVAGYKESAAGTRAMEVAVVLRAWSIWAGANSGFACFTEDTNNFPTLAARN
jgi:hypothetical protein